MGSVMHGETSHALRVDQDLPRSVRAHLPAHAQDIFRSAWRTYGGTDPAHIEGIAHRVAWAAVKKRYRNLGDTWVPREFADH